MSIRLVALEFDAFDPHQLAARRSRGERVHPDRLAAPKPAAIGAFVPCGGLCTVLRSTPSQCYAGPERNEQQDVERRRTGAPKRPRGLPAGHQAGTHPVAEVIAVKRWRKRCDRNEDRRGGNQERRRLRDRSISRFSISVVNARNLPIESYPKRLSNNAARSAQAASLPALNPRRPWPSLSTRCPPGLPSGGKFAVGALVARTI